MIMTKIQLTSMSIAGRIDYLIYYPYTLELVLRLHPQHFDALEAVEHDPAGGPGPHDDGEQPDAVPAQPDERGLGARHEDAVSTENVHAKGTCME